MRSGTAPLPLDQDVGGGGAVPISAPLLVGWGSAAFGPTGAFLTTAALWLLTIVAYIPGQETARRGREGVQL